MRVRNLIARHRRDFTAEFECEHCLTSIIAKGYDDSNFHQNVIPMLVCKECGKQAGEAYRPLTTKYPEGMVM